MIRLRPWAAAMLTLCVAGTLTLAATMQVPSVVVFRNVTVVPMDGDRIVEGQIVMVRGSTIDSVTPSSTTRLPAGAVVIDGTGKFLMPGLTDMHVHLPAPTAPVGRVEAELFLYLANGVTTVRSMMGFDTHLGLRQRIDAGEVLGPTLVLAGPGLDGDRIKTPEQGEREVREQKAQRYDLIKILPGLSLASYNAIVTTARDVGIRVGGHIPADVGIQHALESGQETIEHLDGYLELLNGRLPVTAEAMSAIVKQSKQSGVWNVPTMAVMAANVGAVDLKELVARPELEYIARAYIEQWLGLRGKSNIPKPVAEVIQTNRLHLLKALGDAGARVLVGTDSPQLFNAPGFSIHREMHMMADAGLTASQVLRAATQQPGAYLNRPCGTIASGMCADLILLDSNPLQDLRSLDHQRGVMVRGHWLTEADIQRQLTRIREAPGNYRRRN